MEHSTDAIVAFIKSKVCKALGVSIDDVDESASFDSYGLPSIEAVSLTSEIEEFLGRDIPPDAVFEHPSIRKLADYLVSDEAR